MAPPALKLCRPKLRLSRPMDSRTDKRISLALVYERHLWPLSTYEWEDLQYEIDLNINSSEHAAILAYSKYLLVTATGQVTRPVAEI